MADYCAPLRDMRFILHDVFQVPARYALLPGLAGAFDDGISEAVLEEVGKIAAGVIAPLNRSGDEEDCTWRQETVATPVGFPEACRAYAEGGRVGIGGDPQFVGMDMPVTRTHVKRHVGPLTRRDTWLSP